MKRLLLLAAAAALARPAWHWFSADTPYELRNGYAWGEHE